jgi:hypothetical protein
MSRIPTHTVEGTPDASRPLLQKITQSSPTGLLLNVHAQMAHSPTVLAPYASGRLRASGLATAPARTTARARAPPAPVTSKIHDPRDGRETGRW